MQFFNQNTFVKERRTLFVLFVSSLLGLVAGLLQPAPQVAVEQGQVLAGLVQYPANNPFFIYQAKTWTFLAQSSAIGLRLGLSELALSLFFSGLAGVLSFSGYALWVFALSDDILFSLLTPPLFIKVLEGIIWGFGYPVNLLGTVHTYGLIGMAFIFFTSGLFAVGYRRWAWLFAGLSLAIHPSLGLWFNIILWFIVLSDFKNLRGSFIEAIKFSLPGYILSTASLVYHLSSYQAPPLDATTAHRYMQAYLAYWDDHRMAIGFWRIDVSIVGVGLFMSALWLLFKKNDLPRNVLFILRCYTATVLVGGLMIIILYAPLPFTPPDILSTLLPTRFLNFAIIGYLPLVLGLLWRYRSQNGLRITTAIAITCLALTVFFYDVSKWYLWYLLLFQLVVLGLILLVITRNEKSRVENWSVFFVVALMLIHFLRSSSASVADINIPSRTQAALISLAITSTLFIVPTFLRMVLERTAQSLAIIKGVITNRVLQQQARLSELVSLAALAMIFLWALPLADFFKIQRSFADNFYNTPLYATPTSSRGQMIVADCVGLIQLTTRRPVLNYLPINMLPYAIEGAPAMENILRDIYAMDFFSPRSPNDHIQSVWEKRSTQDWIALGRQYSASEVLAPSSWMIRLEHISNDSTCTMYRIPFQ